MAQDKGLVDPHRLRRPGWGGWLADEPLRVGGVGVAQHLLAGGQDLLGAAEVDVGRVSRPMPEW